MKNKIYYLKSIFLPFHFALAYLIFITISSFATYAGKDTALFLKFNPEPKTQSIGDCYIFSELPVNNPAGLGRLYQPKLFFSHTRLIEDINFSHLSFNSPFSFGRLGFALTYLTYGEIQGIDMNLEEYYLPRSYDISFNISYSAPFGVSLPIYREYGYIGTNLKFIKSQLADYSAEAIAADIGTILDLSSITDIDKLPDVSLVYKNLGSKMKFVKKEFPLPEGFSLGLGKKFPYIENLSISTELEFPQNSNPKYSIGFSIDPIYFLSFSIGYKYISNSVVGGITAGFGVNLGSFNLNYAVSEFREFSTIGDLGLTHQISVGLGIGNFINSEIGSEYYLKQHFNKINELYYQKEYLLAKQQLEELQSLYPDYKPAEELMKKIEKKLEGISAKKEERIKELLKRARISMDRNDLLVAKRNYQTALQIDPENIEAKEGLKKIEEETEKFRQRRIEQQNAKKIAKLWAEGVKYYKNGEYIKSKDKFNQLLSINPEHEPSKKYLTEIDVQIAQLNAEQINGLYLRATGLFKDGKYEEASKFFEAVVIAAPHRLDAKDFLEKCQQAIKEKEEKRRQEELERQQRQMQQELDMTFNTALRYYEKNDYIKALEWFEKSKKIAEKYEFIDYQNKSQSYIETIKLALSEKYYQEGYKLYQQNRIEDAYSQYSKSLEYNPNNVLSSNEINKIKGELSQKYYEIGISYYTRGELEKAKEYFRKSLFYEPNKEETLRALERIK